MQKIKFLYHLFQKYAIKLRMDQEPVTEKWLDRVKKGAECRRYPLSDGGHSGTHQLAAVEVKGLKLNLQVVFENHNQLGFQSGKRDNFNEYHLLYGFPWQFKNFPYSSSTLQNTKGVTESG